MILLCYFLYCICSVNSCNLTKIQVNPLCLDHITILNQDLWLNYVRRTQNIKGLNRIQRCCLWPCDWFLIFSFYNWLAVLRTSEKIWLLLLAPFFKPRFFVGFYIPVRVKPKHKNIFCHLYAEVLSWKHFDKESVIELASQD